MVKQIEYSEMGAIQILFLVQITNKILLDLVQGFWEISNLALSSYTQNKIIHKSYTNVQFAYCIPL